MSRTNKSAVSTLEAIESWIRCPKHVFYWGEEPLSKRNTIFVQDLYTLMACFWYDVTHCPELLNQRWVNCLCSEPVDKVVAFLKDLDFEICSESISSMASFKHWRKSNYPTMGQIIAPLTDNLADFFNRSVGLRSIRTCLRFITRANFPKPLGLEEEAFEDWINTCLIDPKRASFSEEEVNIASTIFPRRKAWFQCDDFRPRFGPGACADPSVRSIEEKYVNFSFDEKLAYTSTKMQFPVTDLPRCSAGLNRTHRIQFVPKQLDKLRVVSMEPHSLMFYQLGGQELMCQLMRHSRWNKHIDLERADLNQDLAWEGSLTGEYATIDLSKASDSVRLSMVRELFDHSCLREILLGTRSNRAQYGKECFTPTYFAPMGSGLCFPVECAVFAVIVEGVMRQNCDRRAWRVYGDDIIVPSDRAQQLIERLSELSFLVNVEKSFYNEGPGFRESCGGDYFRGENVRPVYVSRFWTGLTAKASDPSTIEGLLDLANRLTSYPLTRQRVIRSLLQVKPGVIFDDSGEYGIFSKYPTNFHLQSRYNEDLQTMEFRHGSIRPRILRSKPENEDIRLFEWLRSHDTRKSVDEPSVTQIGRVSRPKWRATWGSPAPGWDTRA